MLKLPSLADMISATAFPGIRISLCDCVINGITTRNSVFEFSPGRLVLSTRNGLREATAVAENSCPEPLWGYVHENAGECRRLMLASAGKTEAECDFLLTGASLEGAVLRAAGDEALVFVTTDVRSNAMRAGVDVPAGKRKPHGPGTINIFLFTAAALSAGAMARSLITITEAKCAALQDMGAVSSYTPGLTATGTGTDNIIIVPGTVPGVEMLRGHSALSLLIARTTAQAIRDALRREGMSGAPLTG